VAHASGISRVDIVSGAVRALASAHDVSLAGFERIRWAHDSLVGVQRVSDDSVRVVRVRIGGGRATAIDVIDSGIVATKHSVVTVSGDEFYFLAQPSDGDADGVVIRRSRIR
jgi:hypothetical protein